MLKKYDGCVILKYTPVPLMLVWTSLGAFANRFDAIKLWACSFEIDSKDDDACECDWRDVTYTSSKVCKTSDIGNHEAITIAVVAPSLILTDSDLSYADVARSYIGSVIVPWNSSTLGPPSNI